MVEIKAPSEVSEEEYEEFKALVRKGTEVFPRTRSELIERARFLAFHRSSGGALIGTGGIKVPRADVRDRVFERVRSSHDPRSFTAEIGWVRVEEGHQEKGIERSIVRALLERIEGERTFALVRADYAELISVLKGQMFGRTGTELPSAKGDYNFVLYVMDPSKD